MMPSLSSSLSRCSGTPSASFVEGKIAVFWEGVNGVGHAVGIAVAQAAVLVEISDKGHAHLEVGGVANGPQSDERAALLEVLEVVDHSFESDISAGKNWRCGTGVRFS